MRSLGRGFRLLVVGIGLLLAGSGSAYELLGTDWSYMANPMGEDWIVCPAGIPGSGVQRTKDGAFEWNYSEFTFTFGADACLSGGVYPTFNNVNQVDFGGGLGPGVLAETAIWFFPSKPEDAVECDMRFSNTFSWYTGTGIPSGTQFDWWSVATHEMGHCLGLDHEADITSPKPVMYPTIGPGEVRRTLTADDIAGRNAIYGAESACPVSTALRGTPEGETALGILYRFRDEVMTKSPEGRRYIRLFYQHAWEGSWLVLRHPDLRAGVRSGLARILPTIRAVLDGHPAALTSEDLAAIEDLMDAFAAKASSRLQQTIEGLRSELQSGQLLSPFGIGVEVSR